MRGPTWIFWAIRTPFSLKVLRLFRLAKMLRLRKLKQVLKRFEDRGLNVDNMVQTGVTLIIIALVAHVLACMYFFIGARAGSPVFLSDHNTNGVMTARASSSARRALGRNAIHMPPRCISSVIRHAKLRGAHARIWE